MTIARGALDVTRTAAAVLLAMLRLALPLDEIGARTLAAAVRARHPVHAVAHGDHWGTWTITISARATAADGTMTRASTVLRGPANRYVIDGAFLIARGLPHMVRLAADDPDEARRRTDAALADLAARYPDSVTVSSSGWDR